MKSPRINFEHSTFNPGFLGWIFIAIVVGLFVSCLVAQAFPVNEEAIRLQLTEIHEQANTKRAEIKQLELEIQGLKAQYAIVENGLFQ